MSAFRNCCGDVGQEARFCDTCGAEVSPGAERACGTCGSRLVEAAGFCDQCGSPTRAEAVAWRPPRRVGIVACAAPLLVGLALLAAGAVGATSAAPQPDTLLPGPKQVLLELRPGADLTRLQARNNLDSVPIALPHMPGVFRLDTSRSAESPVDLAARLRWDPDVVATVAPPATAASTISHA